MLEEKMSHHYKRYTLDQLKEEEHLLKENLTEAKLQDQTKYIAVYQRKIEIVQSYMLDQSKYKAGDYFKLKNDANYLFEIDEMSGVIAWGYLIDPQTREKIDPTNRIAKLLVLLGEKQ